ncbi:SDR family oxidoreductase [Algoriphagus namhaensis]
MSNSIEIILIIGANGATGQIICDLLNDSEQYKPIAMIRKESQQDAFESKGIQTVLADLEENFENAFQDIDKVIFAAGSGGSTGLDKTIAVDLQGAQKAIDLAKKHNLKKFVMLSSMGAHRPDESSEIYEYLKAKHAADEYLKDSGLAYTIVRPGGLADHSGQGKIEAAGVMEKRGKISREDVAKTLVHVLPEEIAPDCYFEILEGDTKISEAIAELVER